MSKLPTVAIIGAGSSATRKRYVTSPRHTIQVDFDRYLHDLRYERRRGARRAHDAGFPLPAPARVDEAMAAA